MELLHNIDWQYLLETYGHWAIFLGTFLEGEMIVILAGMLVAGGNMSLPGVILCAFAGSMTSDQLMFTLGKWKGNAVLARFPRLNKKKDKATRLLLKYDSFLILGFRFVYGIRNVTPLLLGTSGVTYRRFFLFNLIGAACWSTSFSVGGYYFGHAMIKAVELFGRSIIHVVLVLVLVTLVSYLIYRARKKRKPEEPPSQIPPEEI